MYRKISKETTQKIFKPRRMVLGGEVYEVDSIETLNKIKSDIENAKKEQEEVIEEQKNQRVLVKKTRVGNLDEKTTKIISGLSKIPDGNFRKNNINRNKHIQGEEITKKPKFNLVSTACQRKSKDNKLLTTTHQRMMAIKEANVPNEVIEFHSENKPNITNTDNTKKMNIVTHERKPIKKNNEFEHKQIIHDLKENDNNENKYYNDEIPNNNEHGKKLQIVSHERKQIKNLATKPKINSNDENDNESNHDDTYINIVSNIDSNDQVEQINHKEQSESIDMNNELLTNRTFSVIKSQWYVLSIKVNEENEGLIKILDHTKKQIIPLIRICNDMFIYRRYDRNNIEYRIYFKTLINTTNVDIYILGLSVKDIKFQQVTFDIAAKSIDLWKFRKLYDLEFINYYLNNIKLECSDKFMDRFKADYTLFKNTDQLDKFIRTLKIDGKPIHKNPIIDNCVTILYLVYSTIEYENYGYTIRTHYLLKNVNSDNHNVIGVTRYGYPFDKENGYYKNIPKEETIIDGVKYIKLLNQTDNFNSCNIIDYLKKYITSVIKMAIQTNAKIIHATTNYWNGLAAIYAAKYLGIKSIYELRGLWNEGVIANRPEIKNSDMLSMIMNQERKILDNVDKIITINQPIKQKLIEYGYDENRIKVIYNAVNTELFQFNESYREYLRKENKIANDEIVIGYIGTISNYEGIEYILYCIKKLDKVKLVLIGDGLYKNDIMNQINQLNINNKVIHYNKMNHQDVIKYYNMFDIVAYPRKECDLCMTTSSYKVFEAMSMGLPIIVSQLEAWNEIIDDNINGLYCEPDNIEDLLQKIMLLIEDEELRKTLGNNAREWVIKNREWKNTGEELMKFYDEMLYD